jgi:hypothetical protein
MGQDNCLTLNDIKVFSEMSLSYFNFVCKIQKHYYFQRERESMLMEKLKKKIEIPLEEEIEAHRFRTFHTILALNEKKELAHNDWEKVHTVIIIMNIDCVI